MVHGHAYVKPRQDWTGHARVKLSAGAVHGHAYVKPHRDRTGHVYVKSARAGPATRA
ncbi:hypothetical protein [Streptomyces sp. NPDC004291]